MDLTPTPIGGDIRANTPSINDQFYPSIAALNDGGFVVTWTSADQDGSGWGVYGQRYDANGIASGGEFRINTHTSNDQTYSSITELDDGGFLVVWSSLGQDGSGWGTYGQRYDASGTPSGGEFRINTTVANDQFLPSVTALNDGGFVVTWTSVGQDGNGWGVYGQRYGANGNASGGEKRQDRTPPADIFVFLLVHG